MVNNYVFQCFKAKYFGYLQETRAGWQAWLSETFNVLRILEYPIPTISPAMVVPGTLFKTEVLRRLENDILTVIVASHRDILLII